MCCGNKRAQARSGFSATRPRAAKPASPPGFGHSMAYFRYTGRTALLVKGGRTGKRYRFAHPGAVVAVDPGDRRSLLAVPQLRQVRTP